MAGIAVLAMCTRGGGLCGIDHRSGQKSLRRGPVLDCVIGDATAVSGELCKAFAGCPPSERGAVVVVGVGQNDRGSPVKHVGHLSKMIVIQPQGGVVVVFLTECNYKIVHINKL